MKASLKSVRKSAGAKPVRAGQVRAKPARRSASARKPARDSRYSLAAFVRLDRSAVIFLIFAFCLVHWAIRLAVSPVFTI